jgi:alkyl hydroperoxide reductase subunit AhpC
VLQEKAPVVYLEEDMTMAVKVGKPAPEFETKAYIQGEIKTVKLADYKGQWVMLYFYPGDFTFV